MQLDCNYIIKESLLQPNYIPIYIAISMLLLSTRMER